ncbi:hypothetical protein PAXRUDRAFT_207078 [Paxillus rubicundulus Ve08.2h10]|uniref:Uncharacterized protein n=1 Tax=Paxillus rubicundulus Ve08.2h10 TaxID=930991 RepID=A0A0D0EBG8_9AGAM|nr:hypothetical protein PAXRUDRAFT_207078 [Paxillus rubicundulus Ve08.2h10]
MLPPRWNQCRTATSSQNVRAVPNLVSLKVTVPLLSRLLRDPISIKRRNDISVAVNCVHAGQLRCAALARTTLNCNVVFTFSRVYLPHHCFVTISALSLSIGHNSDCIFQETASHFVRRPTIQVPVPKYFHITTTNLPLVRIVVLSLDKSCKRFQRCMNNSTTTQFLRPSARHPQLFSGICGI